MSDELLFPEGVLIDGLTGQLSSPTGRYTKRLSELRQFFHDRREVDHAVATRADPVVYEVIEYKQDGSDISFGTTILEPGVVGDEFYMTRGHFHERRDMGETYYVQRGHGVLLLESRTGQTATVDMKPGVCAFIPPDWAHRSVNTGEDKLVFFWVCNPAAGHDYSDILEHGMRKLVVRRDGVPRVVDNVGRTEHE